MKELVGDLWQEHTSGSVVAITTNGRVTKSGKAIMQRGCAGEAAARDPELAQKLGNLLTRYGNHVFDLDGGWVSFPVEADPFQAPDLRLIERSCRELVQLAGCRGWHRVVVPRPGCGAGGLEWREVKPILARHFDSRFHVISKG